MAEFVLAHLSDPHLGPLPAHRLRELANKRVFGLINWHVRRRGFHRPDVLAAILADLRAHAPHHVAVAGDLVNIGLEGEFAPARSWLERLGSPADVTIVPGNHDAYVHATAGHPARFWSDYMIERGVLAAPDGTLSFPFVRRRGPLALVGVSSAVPTAPFAATGRIGSDQLRRLANVLAELASEERFRVVLIHHPPISVSGARHKRLVDAAALREVLRAQGADLVIHGHEHLHSLKFIAGPRSQIPVLGVPSASAAPGDHHHPAGYNLYFIAGMPGAWRCEAVSRGLGRAQDGIGEISRRLVVG